MWNLFRRTTPGAVIRLPRIHLNELPDVIYAIGDVHGCLDDLKRLEQRIIANAETVAGDKLIVMLGDYVDRGPKSAQVLDWLISPAPQGFERICLRGNHEGFFLDALAQPGRCNDWLAWGGMETLSSYGADASLFQKSSARIRGQILQSVIPAEHQDFLASLPVALDIPGLIFVHAGLRPGIKLAEQTDHDLMWIREPFLTQPHGLPEFVVHGHTPDDKPVLLPHRAGIDTLAYGGGPLTALRITRDQDLSFLTS